MDSPPYRSRRKRLTDVVLAGAILLALTPVLCLAIAAVWLSMGRPVFFTQERTGYAGRPFRLFKLRTMRQPDGTATVSEAHRLTRVGRLLRRTAVDELPQLCNVIRGDMSLVGPRPLLRQYEPWYTGAERLRFAVRPGVTGLSQVNRGRIHFDWDARLETDARYVREWSYRLDVWILVRTVAVVLRGAGFVADPRASLLNLDAYRGLARGSALEVNPRRPAPLRDIQVPRGRAQAEPGVPVAGTDVPPLAVRRPTQAPADTDR